MPPHPSDATRKVLLVLPIGLDEAFCLQHYGKEVALLNRKAQPQGLVGRRVALYAGTRIGNRDFFGPSNRASRDRNLQALGRRIGTVFPGYKGYVPIAADVATYAQRIVAMATISAVTPTTDSPWWDGQSVAWHLDRTWVVKPTVPLDPGPANGNLRTVEEDSDAATFLQSIGALFPEDMGPYVYSRRRS